MLYSESVDSLRSPLLFLKILKHKLRPSLVKHTFVCECDPSVARDGWSFDFFAVKKVFKNVNIFLKSVDSLRSPLLFLKILKHKLC